MSFLSAPFVLFLTAGVIAFVLCPPRWQRHLLLALSAVFYGSYGLRPAALLLGATVLAHLCAKRIAAATDERVQRRWLWLAVGVLLLVLASFKYLPAIGGASAASIVIPLGISYYTFKLIGHVIDAYWGKLGKDPDLVGVAGYAAFFAQIVSGPIQRSGDFRDQTEPTPAPTLALRVSGLRLILFGCFKKLVIADRLGLVVNAFYAHPRGQAAALATLCAYLFPLQLYADFSGFTDVAIGIGRLFGVKAPRNFDSPFYAPTVQAFWQRWHMTLTSWLTAYLFTPLRMAWRNLGQLGLVASTAVTMAAIGLWHGPRWTYLVFGLVNALYVVLSTLTQKRRNRFFSRHKELAGARRLWQPLLVFHLMAAGFVFFRADSLGDAGLVLRQAVAGFAHLPRLNGLLQAHWSREDLALLVLGLALMEAVHWLQTSGRLTGVLARLPVAVRWAGYYALVGATLFGAVSGAQQFIYIKF
jgi:alginate O-acetyltransferase complex protein AlgI